MKLLNFLKKHFQIIWLVILALILINSTYNTVKSNKVYDKLFDAYISTLDANDRQMELINKQIKFIDGMLAVMEEFNKKRTQ